MINEDEKLVDEIKKFRRDLYRPWRYILFTFLNGIAWGLGLALWTTLVLGIIIYILSIVISHLVNFPVIGQYIGDIGKLIDAYTKSGQHLR